jgi:UDP-2,3-diacylglucosamine pyrophosphatase LpxH
MVTLLISDIHLGSPLSRAADLLQLLRSRFWKRVIIVGDAFSHLNFSRLSRDHFLLLDYLRQLTNPKRGVEVVWIEGNHDAGLISVLSNLMGITAYTEYEWDWNGRRCLAIHGHQFDGVITKNPLLTKFVSTLFLELQKIHVVRRHLAMLIDKVSAKWQRLTPKVRERAFDYARKHGFDLIVCGHTHEAHRSDSDGVTYLNTGCWVGADCTYITMTDTELEMHDWNDREVS